MDINMGMIDKSMNLGREGSYLEWPGRYPYAKPLGLVRPHSVGSKTLGSHNKLGIWIPCVESYNYLGIWIPCVAYRISDARRG